MKLVVFDKKNKTKLNMYPTQSFHRPTTFPTQADEPMPGGRVRKTPNDSLRFATTNQQMGNDHNPPYLMQKVNCKLYLPDGDIRRFVMDKPMTLNELFARSLIDTGLKKKDCKLYYKDEELEWIRISKEEEWKEALMFYLNTSQLIKFKLKHIKAQDTAANTGETTTNPKKSAVDTNKNPQPKPGSDYSKQLKELEKMDFLNYKSKEELLQLLKAHNGNVGEVVDILLKSLVPQQQDPFVIESVQTSSQTASTSQKDVPELESDYSEQLKELEKMDFLGYKSKEELLQLLKAYNGNVAEVVNILLESLIPRQQDPLDL
jgi:hypothetical protein